MPAHFTLPGSGDTGRVGSQKRSSLLAYLPEKDSVLLRDGPTYVSQAAPPDGSLRSQKTGSFFVVAEEVGSFHLVR